MTASGVSQREQLPVMHDGDAIDQTEHDVHVVFDHEDGAAVLACTCR